MSDPAATALPSEHYRAGVARGDCSDDPAQHHALCELDRIHAALVRPASRSGWLGRLLGREQADVVPGLYLWGGVGRGKTLLIDLFFDGLPLDEVSAAGRADAPLPHSGSRQRGEGGKRRTHFHRFMLEVHARRRGHADEQDPIGKIAADLAAEVRVLCFDEFFVSDIADAMILG
ncbi:MAG: AFG1/ZapE family ATPase, partial [Luteimonas sp.]